MSNDLMLIFLIAISLFVMQAVGGVFQIKNYKAAYGGFIKKEMWESDRKKDGSSTATS